MGVTTEDVQRLLQLQAQDRVLDTLQASIDKIPVDVEAVRDSLAADKARVAEAKDKYNKLQLSKKEKEMSLSQKEDAIRKHGVELNLVKTNDAYRALQTEIEKAKSDVGDLETDILTLMDEIDQAARGEKEAAAALKETEGRAEQRIRVLEAEKEKLSAEAAQKASARDSLARAIPPDVLRTYQFLRKKRQGVAMAPVNGTMCGACRITILPQSLVELTRGNKLITCENCQRILYRPESVPAVPHPAQP